MSAATAGDRSVGQIYEMKNGIPVLPPRNEVVSVEAVRQIMDEEGI